MKKYYFCLSLMGLFAFGAMGQDIQCYTDDEKQTPDWFLDHPYYATCTDYVGTGSKPFGDDPEYVDFNGGSTVDFTDIYVSQDGYYALTVWYGVGYADETGATLELNVNDAPWDIMTCFTVTNPPVTQEFEIELYGGGFSNTIQFKQVKDWPILSRIQLALVEAFSGTPSIETESCKIVSSQNMIAISELVPNSEISIYTTAGVLVEQAIATSLYNSTVLNEGLYIVKINGEAHKVLVN